MKASVLTVSEELFDPIAEFSALAAVGAKRQVARLLIGANKPRIGFAFLVAERQSYRTVGVVLRHAGALQVAALALTWGQVSQLLSSPLARKTHVGVRVQPEPEMPPAASDVVHQVGRMEGAVTDDDHLHAGRNLPGERLDAFLFEFVNTNGETVQLGEDNVRSFKFPEYPNQGISRSADDFPFLRYADILLTRAEALNEINGPNDESVELLNMVRDAAGVSTFTVGDFASKADFRDFLLDERGREFHTEALRRQDLIRHGKFIDMAQDRGKPAQDFHVRYPIPQTEVERNANLDQNDGY
jgi:hypothetical protein